MSLPQIDFNTRTPETDAREARLLARSLVLSTATPDQYTASMLVELNAEFSGAYRHGQFGYEVRSLPRGCAVSYWAKHDKVGLRTRNFAFLQELAA